MRPSLISIAPAPSLLTINEARAQVVVEHDLDDDLIGGLIAAAQSHLDGADGILGRALIAQRWRAVWSRAPLSSRVALPLPRLISVEEVKFYDAAGVAQALDGSRYRSFTLSDYGGVELVAGADWPSVQAGRADAFHIDFTAGYGVDASDVPGAILAAAKLLVGHLYRHREASTSLSLEALPMGVHHLIAPFRVAEGLF